MDHSLRLGIWEADLIWENPEANLTALESLYWEPGSLDLLVLPEMYSTGFTMNPEGLPLNESPQHIQRLSKISEKRKTNIAASFIWKEQDSYRNRFILISENGIVSHYDKKHLFSLGGESKKYTPGSQSVIWDIKNWKISPFICYDLRFPEWCRNNGETDLIIFTANWPSSRQHHWDALLTARAIENQCYVMGVNRVGQDGNGLVYSGGSKVITPNGVSIHGDLSHPPLVIHTISKQSLDDFRNRFPFLQDRFI